MGSGEIVEDQEGFIPDSEFVPDPTPMPSPSVQQSAPQGQPPGFIPDDKFVPDKPEQTPGFISDKDFVSDEDKYSTPGQQVLTAIEGAGRGLSAGLTDVLAPAMRGAATALGVPDEYLHYVAPKNEDMAARQSQNPITSTASELAGNIGLMSKLPQIGSKAINGMIQMGLIAGGDELSKAMLGKGDPSSAVAAHIAASGALGLIGGAAFGAAEKYGAKSLKAIENSKVGSKLSSFLSGLGHAAHFPGEEIVSLEKSSFLPEEIKNLDDKAFLQGQKAYNTVLSGGVAKAAKYGSRIAAPLISGALGVGSVGTAASIAIEQALEHALGYAAPKVSQRVIGPALLRYAASGAVESAGEVLNHATRIGRGAQKISHGIEALFDSTSNKAIDYLTSEKDREKLKEFIENGGVDQQIQEQQGQPDDIQGFAKGGHVEPMPQLEHSNAVAHVFPEQNIMLNTAKARISGYLNSVRPLPNQAKLPYDVERKDHHKEREYDKVLDLANQPLSILNHIKKGSLVPSQVKAFTQMYPELYGHLSKKITERMLHGQMKEEKKPPYHTRQAMSLFLGAPLDSTLTQQSIMAAQMTFVQQKAQNIPKNSGSAMNKMGENAMTPEQSRTQRLNKG